MPSPPVSADLQPRSRAHGALTWSILIVATVLILFGPICRNSFLAFDDDRTIQFNPRISDPSLSNVAWYWRHAYMDLYVPVTYTVWSGLSFVSRLWHGEGQPDPAIFHAASVGLHALNAILVFLLLWRLIKKPAPAAAGALLFAMHPVQVEAVAWASGLKDLLCATFSLIALLQSVAAVSPVEKDGRQTLRPHVHYAIGLFALALGMLCKPTAMVMPVMALILDWLLLRRPWRAALRSVGPWLGLSLACAVWTKLCQPSDFRHAVALWQRPLIAGDALAFYLFKLVWPARLSYDYGRTPALVLEHGWEFVTWLAPASIAAILFVCRKRAAVVAAAALLLVAGLAPVLGLTTFDFQVYSGVADHYLYLAMLGPALAAAWFVNRFRADARVVLATTCILGLLAVRTETQTRYWRDDQTFFTHAIEINPRSWGSYFALATVAHNRAAQLANDPAAADASLRQALELYHRTLELNPNHLGAEHSYATILMHFGRWQKAAAALADVVARRDRLPPGGRVQFAQDDQMLAYCLGRVRDGHSAATASSAD
ncbi:MAG TPA: hypothetical protein VN541_07615 [Tepidisphaeraceae bacterium]|nr:hypothetical protein [Tepidisphaeraceae bacterium]